MMNRRSGPLLQTPVTDFLLARDERGLGKYRKRMKRDPDERAILLDLALRKIEKAERKNFILLGFRRRRVSFF